MKLQLLLTAVVVAIAILVQVGLSDTILYYYMYPLVERWDKSLEFAQLDKIFLRENDNYYGEELAETLLWIGSLQEILEEYDDAILTYEDELIPAIRRRKANNGAQLGIAFSYLAGVYRKKGMYKKGLEVLWKSQRAHLSAPNIQADSFEIKENQISIDRMKKLIKISSKQKRYVENLIEIAERWRFSTRIQDADADDICEEKNQIKRRDRFYIPAISILIAILAPILYLTVYLLWRNPTHLRVCAVTTILTPVLAIVSICLTWNYASYTEGLNLAALIEYRFGNIEKSLRILDESRCTILKNPYDECMITSAVGIDTFISAMYGYSALGEYEIATELEEDINELISSNRVLKNSIIVLGYYLFLAETYYSRDDEMMSQHYSMLATKEMNGISFKTEKELLKALGSEKTDKSVNTSVTNDQHQVKDMMFYLDGVTMRRGVRPAVKARIGIKPPLTKKREQRKET